MDILLCASEVAPFSKTGGLADVAGSLPPGLRQRGLDVRIVTPLHGGIDRARFGIEPLHAPLGVPVGFTEQWCAIHQGTLPETDVPVYFIEHERYFGRSELYQWQGKDYDDNAERFAFFSRACLQLCKALGYSPDVIHCHDWQTGLVPVYLKTWEREHPLLSATASVMTIHNIGYQGLFAKDQIVHTQLGWELYTPGGLEFHDQINYLKAGILWSDKLSTVSPRYAWEIQTPEGGWALDGALRSRSADLVGILNGLDYREWGPSKDKRLPATYDVDDMEGKLACKRALQQEFGLPIRDDVPVIGMVSRLAYQKGIDILAAALPAIFQMDMQFVVLGTGETWAHFVYGDLPNQNPGKAGVFIGFDARKAHLVFAGSDFTLVPSRYEPCGLTQLTGLRYGSVPIVRATGGLEDTVEQYDEAVGGGTGFKFYDLSAQAIADTIGWAVSTFYDRPEHLRKMIDRGMRLRFSWDDAAERYEELYRWAVERRHGL